MALVIDGIAARHRFRRKRLTTVRILGIDCATDDARIGLSHGRVRGSVAHLDRVVLCGRDQAASLLVARWLREEDTPTLLAIDAPLGWPRHLAESLVVHRAGVEITHEANALFRRETDRHVQRRIGKTPLDVGADRIARTAHAALRLVGTVRRDLGAEIPLAWWPDAVTQTSMIEVYPAATLTARGWRASGYKKREQIEERREIIRSLSRVLRFAVDTTAMEASADVLDAAICVLAGLDFLSGRSVPPDDRVLAEHEGWIWVPDKATFAG